MTSKTAPGSEGVSSDDRFVDYYSRESVSSSAIERFSGIKSATTRLRRSKNGSSGGLTVLDIGCNAGTQSMMWAQDGHRVSGIDISIQLVDLAKERAKSSNLDVDFRVGSATDLPWDDGSFDICLLPELLEHVDDWESCLNEACRVMRPEGILYLSTTNRMCPVQQEFNLPVYSWYPRPVKRYFERLSTTTRPDLVNFATFPAVHWFTFGQLSRFLAKRGFESFDRFQMIDSDSQGALKRTVARVLRASSVLRFIGRIATPYTVVFAYRPKGQAD